MDDIDAYRLANVLIRAHREAARQHATTQQKECQALGNDAGAEQWAKIEMAVTALLRSRTRRIY